MNVIQHSSRIALRALLYATLALVVAMSVGVRPAAAQGQGVNINETPSVTVSGIGRVDVEPDRAMIRLGVESQAEVASNAMQQNNQQMQELINALTEAGVPEANIQTQTVSLTPIYASTQPTQTGATTQPVPPVDDPGNNQGDEVTGYRATNIVRVTTDNLDELGALIDTAVQAGGNRIQGIYFTVSDQTAALNDARMAAWEQARAQAEQLAELAGAQLGRALTINDYSSPQPLVQQSSFDTAAAEVPIMPGTQAVEANLQITWELLYESE